MLVALLSWYDEPASWLAECVASLGFCDHLIAVDGAYALFPGSLHKPRSGSEQAETILRVASGLGLGVTLHIRDEPWWGGEVEKRDFMFRLGELFADWYLRIDADEVVTSAPFDLKQRLETTPHDVAEFMLWEENQSWESTTPLRGLIRNQPDLHIGPAHYLVTAGDRVLVGNSEMDVEPAEQIWDMRVEHRRAQRSRRRLALKDEYGRELNRLKVEAL